MKKLLLSLVALLFIFSASKAETNEFSYLKIVLSAEKTISYPPETGFLVQDAQGNTILNPADLEQSKKYEIVTPITLFVFVSWNDEPDVYELTSGTLLLGKTSRTYVNSKQNKNSPPKDHFSRPTDGDDLSKSKSDRSDKRKNDVVYVVKEQYFSYDEKTGHDLSLEFSNGVIFYYRDGKAVAWENGRLLKMTGKYVIEIPDGFLKISYHPFTKKIWWCTSKN